MTILSIHKKTALEDNVFVGSHAYIKDSHIGSNVVINPGAVIDNCIIGANSIIGAGVVLEPGTKVPENEIWVGNPAKFLRNSRSADMDFFNELFYHQDKVTHIMKDQKLQDIDFQEESETLADFDNIDKNQGPNASNDLDSHSFEPFHMSV